MRYDFLVAGIGLLGAASLALRVSIIEEQLTIITPTPPPTPTPTPAITPTPLPVSINIPVPFTVQAPDGNWALPYQDFCEEASLLMAAAYIQERDIINPDEELKGIQKFEMDRFGYYKDTTAQEGAIILQEYFGISTVRVMHDPSAQDIRKFLAQKKIIVAPMAGRMLGNPNFRPPGPIYHMLVIKGYTEDGQFITNDPGTRHGADYIYDEKVIMNAMHDWRSDGAIEQGKKAILIVG